MTRGRNVLKYVITNVLAVLGLFVLLFFGCYGVNYYETHYTMNAIVIGVEDNKILIEDDTNNLWEFIGDNYQLNDIVSVTFYTNYTDNTREDDEVTKVRTIYHYKNNN